MLRTSEDCRHEGAGQEKGLEKHREQGAKKKRLRDEREDSLDTNIMGCRAYLYLEDLTK